MRNYMFTFFTTNEANTALPDVIKKFEYALAKNTEVKKIEQEFQISISTKNSFESYVNLKQKLNSAITKFYESVEILENKGYLISLQNDLKRKFGSVGNMVRLKLNSGMKKILVLWVVNQLKLMMIH
jgi:hypothetical protein